MSSEDVSAEEFKGFLKEHWGVVLIFVAAIIGACIGGIIVLFRYINLSVIGGNGTWDIGDFSVGAGILWMLLLCLWELLLVVLPFIGFCLIVLAISWWSLLTEEERTDLKTKMKREETKEARKKRRKYSGGGGGFSFITFIAFLIIVAQNGRWLEPIGNIPYIDFVIYYINAMIWIAIIFGIPACIVLILWLLGKIKIKKE